MKNYTIKKPTNNILIIKAPTLSKDASQVQCGIRVRSIAPHRGNFAAKTSAVGSTLKS